VAGRLRKVLLSERGAIDEAILWACGALVAIMATGFALYGVRLIGARDTLHRAVTVLAQGETVGGCLLPSAVQAAARLLVAGGLDPALASLSATTARQPYGAVTTVTLRYTFSPAAAGHALPWTETITETAQRVSQYVPELENQTCVSSSSLG
jgi:Flp pilus assembly protein protease CpaA